MIVGVAVILLGGMGVYYALTGNDPLDALRRAVSGQSPIPSQTFGTGGFTSKGVTLDPRITEPRGGPPNLRSATVRGTLVELVPSALRGYIEAVKCYGKAIPLTSSYRSHAEQAALYASKPGVAAPPGTSLHERGLAIDVNTANLNSQVVECLKRAGWFQGSTFGEPWHFSYGMRG
jgi:hypothetical protein